MDFVTKVKRRRLGKYKPFKRGVCSMGNFWDEFASDDGGQVVAGGMRGSKGGSKAAAARRRRAAADGTVFPVFMLQFNDMGAGQVDLHEFVGGVAPTFTRTTTAMTTKLSPTFVGNYRPTMMFDFMQESTIDQVGAASMTFTRSGTATRVNNAKKIEVVAADTPRFDYDPVTGVLRGLLIEPGVTNLWKSSGDLRASLDGNPVAGWGNFVDADTDAIISTVRSPSGEAATKLRCTTTGPAQRQVSQAFTGTDNTVYTCSVFAKKGEASAIALAATTKTPAFPNALFDLATGTLIGNFSSGGESLSASGIEPWGDGWYRCWISFDVKAGAGSPACNFQLQTAAHSNFSGNIGDGLYLWGAQAELSPNWLPTSYIPTTTATVTRGSDQGAVSSLAGFYSQIAGTLLQEIYVPLDQGTTTNVHRFLGGFNDGTSNNRVAPFVGGDSDTVRTVITTGGVGQSDLTTVGFAYASIVKHACAWQTNDLAGCINGGAVATDTTISVPTVDRFTLLAPGNQALLGHLRRIAYFPSRLQDAALQALTTGSTALTNGVLLTQVASGVARSYYDPTSKNYLGYLAEGQRTNLVVRSEEAENASWVKTDTTPTANQDIAPDGAMTADHLAEGVAGTASVVSANFTITAAAAVAGSVWLKRGNHDWVAVVLADSTVASFVTVWFNLATGAVGSAVNTGVATNAAGFITAYPNGWYRCEVRGNINGGFTSANLRTRSSAADNSATRVNNATRYQWGAQAEDNVVFASTYIPTAGASATRNADVLTYPITVNSSQVSFFAELTPLGINSPTALGIAALYTGVNDAIELGINAVTNAFFANIYSGGVYQGPPGAGTAVVNTPVKIGCGCKTDDGQFVVNGILAAADISLTPPASLTALGVGTLRNGTSGQPFAAISSVSGYNTRLPNSRIQSLTA